MLLSLPCQGILTDHVPNLFKDLPPSLVSRDKHFLKRSVILRHETEHLPRSEDGEERSEEGHHDCPLTTGDLSQDQVVRVTLGAVHHCHGARIGRCKENPDELLELSNSMRTSQDVCSPQAPYHPS